MASHYFLMVYPSFHQVLLLWKSIFYQMLVSKSFRLIYLIFLIVFPIFPTFQRIYVRIRTEIKHLINGIFCYLIFQNHCLIHFLIFLTFFFYLIFQYHCLIQNHFPIFFRFFFYQISQNRLLIFQNHYLIFEIFYYSIFQIHCLIFQNPLLIQSHQRLSRLSRLKFPSFFYHRLFILFLFP